MKKYTSFGQYQTGCRVTLLSVLLICQGARADPVPVTSSNFSQMLHNPSGNYQLVEDIFWPQAWEPWNFPPFSGVFNGDNHVVHNATLSVQPDQGTGQGGFFQANNWIPKPLAICSASMNRPPMILPSGFVPALRADQSDSTTCGTCNDRLRPYWQNSARSRKACWKTPWQKVRHWVPESGNRH